MTEKLIKSIKNKDFTPYHFKYILNHVYNDLEDGGIEWESTILFEKNIYRVNYVYPSKLNVVKIKMTDKELGKKIRNLS